MTAAAHGERLGDPSMPLEAVLAGLAEGGARHGVECRVISTTRGGARSTASG